MNNINNNTNDVVNDLVNADEDSTPKNNEVLDGFSPINEGVTKDVSLSKRLDKKS